MGFFRIRFFVSGLALLSQPLFAKKIEIQVLAKLPSVGTSNRPSSLDQSMDNSTSSSISNRQVAIDFFIDNPEEFPPEGRRALTAEEQGEYLQRVLLQKMVYEESRIFAAERVRNDWLEAEVASLKKKMGDRFKIFMSDFDLSTLELKEILRQKNLLRLALDEKVEMGRKQAEGKPQADREAEKISERLIAEMIKQLKSRYKVQLFL